MRFGYEDAGSGTSTIQYFDYSNNGDLFIGGALGEAFISHYRWNNNNSSDRIEMEEQRINGTINFNGRFEGSIVFENFQVETDWSSWTTRRITNGRVVLRSGGNNIDISDDMMDFRISYW